MGIPSTNCNKLYGMTSGDIVWIKNVLREKGASWAYADAKCGEEFLLNWPTTKKGSAETPNEGDIIVLFQRPKTINGKKNELVHLTHLVAPVNDTVLEDKDSPDHRWCRKVEVVAVAKPIYAIPNPGYFNFFKPNRGLTNPIRNLTNDISLSEDGTKQRLWELFEPHLCFPHGEVLNNEEEEILIIGEYEGDKAVLNHVRQELSRRSKKIVLEAKSLALKKGNGFIKCECCNFDFVSAYGKIGHGFIECHHKIPIAEGGRLTKVSDLAMVCSNCHRMLHRRNQNGEYHSIETLKSLIG